MNHANRRKFLIASGALLAAPLAKAQPTAKMRVFGILSPSPPPTPEQLASFWTQGPLAKLGWIDGKNLVVEPAYGEGREDRLPDLAVELVKKRPDVIWALGPEAAVAAARATKSIPIVFWNVGVPIELGLIDSYSRPGRNVTGIAHLADPEVFGKLVEFVLQLVPSAKRLAYLSNAGTYRSVSGADIPGVRAPVEAAAKRFNLQVRHYPVGRREDFDIVFPAILDWQGHALLDLGTPLTARERPRIIEFVNRSRLPGVSTQRAFAEAGGLLSYGSVVANTFARSFDYVARILNGAKPADLPVELPSEVELVVNLKTARALGLTIPQSVLLRANQVIE